MPKYLRKMTKRMIRARYFPQSSQLEDIFLSEEVYCSLTAEVLNTFGWLQYIRRIMFVQRDRFICETNYKRAHLWHMNDQFIRSQKHKRSKYFLLWLDICWLKLWLKFVFNFFLKDTITWQELSTRLYLCFCLQFIALRRRYMLILPPLPPHDCCL